MLPKFRPRERFTLHGTEFHARKRFAVLGAKYTGKSAFIISAVQSRFEKLYMPTFDDIYDYETRADNVLYHVVIVDADGQEDTSPFGLQYTIGVDAYIYMFSVVDRASFALLELLNDKLLETLAVDKGTRGVWEVPRVVVGNKNDLKPRTVSWEEGAAFAERLGVPYVETSASKPKENKAIFDDMLIMLQQNLTDSYSDGITRNPRGIRVPRRDNPIIGSRAGSAS